MQQTKKSESNISISHPTELKVFRIVTIFFLKESLDTLKERMGINEENFLIKVLSDQDKGRSQKQCASFGPRLQNLVKTLIENLIMKPEFGIHAAWACHNLNCPTHLKPQLERLILPFQETIVDLWNPEIKAGNPKFSYAEKTSLTLKELRGLEDKVEDLFGGGNMTTRDGKNGNTSALFRGVFNAAALHTGPPPRILSHYDSHHDTPPGCLVTFKQMEGRALYLVACHGTQEEITFNERKCPTGFNALKAIQRDLREHHPSHLSKLQSALNLFLLRAKKKWLYDVRAFMLDAEGATDTMTFDAEQYVHMTIIPRQRTNRTLLVLYTLSLINITEVEEKEGKGVGADEKLQRDLRRLRRTGQS